MNTFPFLLSLLITTSLLTQPQAFAMGDELQHITFTVPSKKPSIFPAETPSSSEEKIIDDEEEKMLRKVSRDIGAVLVSQKSSLDQFWLRIDPEEFKRNLSSSPFVLKADATLEEFSTSAASQLTHNINDTIKIYTTPQYQSTLEESVLLSVKSKRVKLKEKVEEQDTLKSALEEMLIFLHATEKTFITAFQKYILKYQPHKELEGYLKLLKTFQTEKINKQKAEESARIPLQKSGLISPETQNPLVIELKGYLVRLAEMQKTTESTYKRLTVRPQQLADIASTHIDEEPDSLSPRSSSAEPTSTVASPRSVSPLSSSGMISPRSGSPSSSRITSPRSESQTDPTSPRPSSSKSEEGSKKTTTFSRNRSTSQGHSTQHVISTQDLKKSEVLKRTTSINTEVADFHSSATPSSSRSNSPSTERDLSETDAAKKPKTLLSRLRSLSIGKKDKDIVTKSGSSPTLQPSLSSSADLKRSSTPSIEQEDESSSSSSSATPTSPTIGKKK